MRFGRTSTTGSRVRRRDQARPMASTPTNRLLTAAAGQVLFLFIEAYGQQAVEGQIVLPLRSMLLLLKGDKRLASAGSALSQRLPRLGDNAGGISWLAQLEPAGGTLGPQPGPLRSADNGQALHARRGVQGGRLAPRRRRSIERPSVATGEGVLPLRPGLQPLSGPVITGQPSPTRRCPISTSSRRSNISSSRNLIGSPLSAEVDHGAFVEPHPGRYFGREWVDLHRDWCVILGTCRSCTL